MLSDRDIDRLSEQFRSIENADIHSVYLRLAIDLGALPGAELKLGGHGYIRDELRVHFGDQRHFSAVLNKKSVLFYIEKAAIDGDHVDHSVIHARIPNFSKTTRGQRTLSVVSLSDATVLIEALKEAIKLGN